MYDVNQKLQQPICKSQPKETIMKKVLSLMLLAAVCGFSVQCLAISWTLSEDGWTSFSSERIEASHNGSESDTYTIKVPAGKKATVKLYVQSTASGNISSRSLYVNWNGGGENSLSGQGSSASRSFTADATVTIGARCSPGTYEEAHIGYYYTSYGQMPYLYYTTRYYSAYYFAVIYDIEVSYESLLPDLTIANLAVSPKEIAVDERATLSYTIKNEGGKSADASIAGVYDNDIQIGQINVDGLSGGAYKTGTFSLPMLTEGHHTIKMGADISEAVSEISEGNNSKSVAVYVYRRVPYTITFNTNGGGKNTSATIVGGNKIGTLPTPVRTGYGFAGWWTEASGGSQIDQDTLVVAKVSYYAHWTAKQSKIDFYQNGGGFGSRTVTATYDSDMPTIAIPQRNGYVFGGYYGGLNGTGVKYYDDNGASAHVWDKEGDSILYAYWKNVSATIALDFQGGTKGAASVVAAYDRDLPKVTVPTRSGWVFQGYFGEADGQGTQYYDANGCGLIKSGITGPVTLYAYWLPQKTAYALTLNRQGGTGGDKTAKVAYGANLPKIEPPIKNKYVFGGYYAAPNGAGIKYYDNHGESEVVWKGTSNLTVYAAWTKANHITFDANGGTGKRTEQYLTDDKWTLAANTFTSNGCVFAGWALSPDGEPKFADGQVVDRALLGLSAEDDQGITLYAKFGVVLKQKLCPSLKLITGGSRPKAYWRVGADGIRNSIESGSSWLCAKLEGPGTLNYSIFDYTNRHAAVSKSMQITNGTNLATWSRVKAPHEKLGEADGTNNIARAIKEQYDLLEVATEECFTYLSMLLTGNDRYKHAVLELIDECIANACPYYSFVRVKLAYTMSARCGYNTSELRRWIWGEYPYHGCDEIANSLSYRMEVPINTIWELNKFASEYDTIQAIEWKRQCYATFVVDGDESGAGTEHERRLLYVGDAVGALPELAARAGYTFQGWYTKPTGGSKISDTYAVKKDTAFYARWKTIGYAVKFNTQGGKSLNSQTVHYGDKLPELPIPERAGYIFDGWCFDDAGSRVADADYTITGEITLYARWIYASKPKVSFDANGGSIYEEWRLVDKGAAIGTLPTPTRAGYGFAGWYTAKSGGTKIGASTIVKSNIVYYAHWTINTHKLTFKLGANVAKIYYKINGAKSWTAITKETTLNVNDGSTWYAYADGKSGYVSYYPDKTKPLARVKAKKAETVTFVAKVAQYKLTLKPGANIAKVYYRINGAKSWTAITKEVTLNVNGGSTWYAYAEGKTGYTSYCPDKAKPLARVKARTTEAITFKAKAVPTYTLTLKPGANIAKVYYKVNGATAWTAITRAKTLNVYEGSTWYAYAEGKTGYTSYCPDPAKPLTRVKAKKTETVTFAAKAVPAYKLTLKLGAHIAKIYYKVNGATAWTAITKDKTLNVYAGSTWYAYATGKSGYVSYCPDKTKPLTRTKAAKAETVTFGAKAIAKSATPNLLAKAAVADKMAAPEFTVENGALLEVIPNGATELAVPDTVIEIGEAAFVGCTEVERVVLPETVEVIGEFAFFGCAALEELVLPTGELEVGDTAFLGCPGLADEDGAVIIDGIPFDCSMPDFDTRR